MKKSIFLCLGLFSLFTLASCDAQDEKAINAAIEGKSNQEISRMVKEANEAQTSEEENYFKMSAEYQIAGSLDSMVFKTDVKLNGQLKAVYNDNGLQLSTGLSSEVSYESQLTNKGSASFDADLTIESLKDESDVYVLASLNGKSNVGSIDETHKVKVSKNNFDLFPTIEGVESPTTNESNLDFTFMYDYIESASISVDDGMLLFTWQKDALETIFKTNNMDYSYEGLEGSIQIGVNKNYRLSKVLVDLKLSQITAKYNEMSFNLKSPTIYFEASNRYGKFSFKMLKHKDTYQESSLSGIQGIF